MNELYIVFVVMAILVVFLILNWYRNKELHTLKVIELKIIAAENNLHYTEDGTKYLNQLNRLDLQPGATPLIKNILESNYGTATIRIFDAFHVVKSGKSRKQCNLLEYL